jgi:hypothetical protein
VVVVHGIAVDGPREVLGLAVRTARWCETWWMPFVGDVLASWLIGKIAEEGSRRAIAWLRGPDHERALRPESANRAVS